jgi:SAM-dependent methyltransferase
MEYAPPEMNPERLRDHWDALGRRDPLWAVLSVRGRESGGWDVDEFLRTGRDDVSRYLAMLGEGAVRRGRALDFGCGVGRLTQALAVEFESCDGVDIAPSMIELARELNQHGERCRYHLNTHADLALFPSETFDFVLCVLVLQHMEPRYALRYMRELLRVLRPDGAAVIQLPSEPRRRVPKPLPPEALRPDYSVRAAPERLERGQGTRVELTVRNASPVAWPADLRLGNHWRASDGTQLVADDGRVELGRELAPGEAAELSLPMTAPGVPGPWMLEIDLVQEHVAWFEARGAEPLRIEVADAGGGTAIAAPAPSGEAADDHDPWMPMHAIPRDEFVAFVEACGGTVERAIEDADSEYTIFHYVIRRGEPRPARASLRRAVDAVAELPDRPDMLPPLVSRRRGRARAAELAVKRAIARATRWFTIEQVEHDRATARALMEMQAVIAAHEAEIERLRAELAERDDG